MNSPRPDRLVKLGGEDGVAYGLSEWEYRVGPGEYCCFISYIYCLATSHVSRLKEWMFWFGSWQTLCELGADMQLTDLQGNSPLH